MENSEFTLSGKSDSDVIFEWEKLMKNILLCAFMLVIAVYMNDSNAQSTVDSLGNPSYKIGGEIHLKEISKSGNLYILLVTEETFKTPFHSFKKLIL